MGRYAHLLVVFIACCVAFCQAKAYFPKLRDFAENSPIKASSTCGETEMKYCDANTLRRAKCTEEVCKFACCPTCSDASPNEQNLADRGRFTDIYDGQPRPGTTQNSLGFDAQKGSYIDVGRLPSVDHKTKGFTICVWVNQTTGNEG